MRRRTRHHEDDMMQRAWKPITLTLGIFIMLGAAAAALAPAYRVPFALGQLREQMADWKVGTHEPRITALERSNERIERQITDLSRDVQTINLTVATGLTEIKTLVAGITGAVNDAQRKANAAEQAVEDYQVGVDDVLRRMDDEQRRLHNLPEPTQAQRGKP